MEQEFYNLESQFQFTKGPTVGFSCASGYSSPDNNVNIADATRQVNLNLLLFLSLPASTCLLSFLLPHLALLVIVHSLEYCVTSIIVLVTIL